ncbi:hypothetical protein AOLI_G00182230 [Acnodon oligacanthus]
MAVCGHQRPLTLYHCNMRNNGQSMDWQCIMCHSASDPGSVPPGRLRYCNGWHAVGCSADSNRDFHPGASIAWPERESGDDSGIKTFYSGEYWENELPKREVALDHWKSCSQAGSGFLAALAASVLGWVLDDSVVTAFTASLLQGINKVGVIIVSKRAGVNPDNIATPIAASFGDFITLGLLAVISQGFFNWVGPNSRTAQVLAAPRRPAPLAAFTQVFLLLCIADQMVHCLWRYGRGPDSFAIPYLTALGDLLGTALLALFLLTSGYH